MGQGSGAIEHPDGTKNIKSHLIVTEFKADFYSIGRGEEEGLLGDANACICPASGKASAVYSTCVCICMEITAESDVGGS